MAVGTEDIQFSQMGTPVVRADGHAAETIDGEHPAPRINADALGLFTLQYRRPHIAAVIGIGCTV